MLIAEDNPVNQRVLQLMLAKLDVSVDTVADGRAAVDAVEQTQYDVVLMDVMMPKMDGLEASRTIAAADREERPYMIAVTASTDRAICRAAGMDDYLAKPVRLADLRRALTNALSRARSRRGGPIAQTDG